MVGPPNLHTKCIFSIEWKACSIADYFIFFILTSSYHWLITSMSKCKGRWASKEAKSCVLILLEIWMSILHVLLPDIWDFMLFVIWLKMLEKPRLKWVKRHEVRWAECMDHLCNRKCNDHVPVTVTVDTAVGSFFTSCFHASVDGNAQKDPQKWAPDAHYTAKWVGKIQDRVCISRYM